jgi:hypothetical protein
MFIQPLAKMHDSVLLQDDPDVLRVNARSPSDAPSRFFCPTDASRHARLGF